MHEHIVVVLNDTPLADLAVTALNDLGYEAVAIHDPMAALTLLESPEQIDVLITSGNFTGQGKPNGLSLTRMARVKHLDMKALFLGPIDIIDIVSRDGAYLATPTNSAEIASAVVGMMASVPAA